MANGQQSVAIEPLGANVAHTGPAETYPSPVHAWATVIILLLMYLTSLVDRNILSLLGEHIRKDLDLSDYELSLLYGPSFAIAYAAGALPLGWAMDRYSRRVVIWSGVTVWSLATMACGLSRTFAQLFAARIFVGAGEAVLVPGNQSILADIFKPDRLAFPISIYTLGSKFGQGFSLIAGGLLAGIIAPAAILSLPLLGDTKGWQVILMIVGFPGILIALLIFLVPEPARRRLSRSQAEPVGYGVVLQWMKRNVRFFTGLAGGAVVASVAVSAIMAWAPAYFMRVHGMPTAQVGLWLGVAIALGPAIGLPVHGLIADRLYRRGIPDAHIRYLVCACILSVVPLTASFLVGDPWVALVLLSVGYALFGAYPVLAPTALQIMLPGEVRGKTASVSLVITSVLGLSLGPPITAWISNGLFSDPNEIGKALAICVVIFVPLTAFVYGLACKPLRAALGGQR